MGWKRVSSSTHQGKKQNLRMNDTKIVLAVLQRDVGRGVGTKLSGSS